MQTSIWLVLGVGWGMWNKNNRAEILKKTPKLKLYPSFKAVHRDFSKVSFSRWQFTDAQLVKMQRITGLLTLNEMYILHTPPRLRDFVEDGVERF